VPEDEYIDSPTGRQVPARGAQHHQRRGGEGVVDGNGEYGDLVVHPRPFQE
jgi:hypothetical protein